MDSIKSAINTAFGAVPFVTYEDKTDNYTITTADKGKLIAMTVTGKTFTLPAAATAGANFMVALLCDTITTTIDGSGSETIDGSTTLTLVTGEWAFLICDGSAWRALDTTGNLAAARLVYANDSAYSVSDTTATDIISNIPVKPSTWYRYRLVAEANGGGGFGFLVGLHFDGIGDHDNGNWGAIANEAGGAPVYDAGVAGVTFIDLSSTFGALSLYRIAVQGYYKTGSTATLLDIRGSTRGATSTASTVAAKECFIVLEEMR